MNISSLSKYVCHSVFLDFGYKHAAPTVLRATEVKCMQLCPYLQARAPEMNAGTEPD